MCGSRYCNRDNPNKKRGNNGQGNQIESGKNLQHQFSGLIPTKALSPLLPALTEKGIKELLARISG